MISVSYLFDFSELDFAKDLRDEKANRGTNEVWVGLKTDVNVNGGVNSNKLAIDGGNVI